MAGQTIAGAVILGITEGLTEFLPVSSTGHILLLGELIGFESTEKTFEILIQLGAILALLSVYFSRLWSLVASLPSSSRSRHFTGGIVLAFLPAAVVGIAGYSFIKAVLFETPVVICTMLIIGGLILLFVDRLQLKPKYFDVMDYPLSLCFKIGLFQCLAMIPGTSRSGATIVGSLLMGTDKRSAAEFSFFLAMPTMAGAFAYDLYKNIDHLSADDLNYILVGFVMAFISAFAVVRVLLDFISRNGFALFAWWRMIVGSAGMAWIYLV